MVSAKAYKVQDVNRKKRVGIVANSLTDLKHKGASKLAVPGDCRQCVSKMEQMLMMKVILELFLHRLSLCMYD